MGWQLQTDSNALGVLGLVGSRAADLEVFAYLPPSPPPVRRGQGWWFAVLRSSAAGRPGFQGAALNDFWLLFFTEK